MNCQHDLATRETACADGLCPVRLRVELDKARQALGLAMVQSADQIDDLKRQLNEIRNYPGEVAASNGASYIRADVANELRRQLAEANQKIMRLTNDRNLRQRIIENTHKLVEKEISALRTQLAEVQRAIDSDEDEIRSLNAIIAKKDEALRKSSQIYSSGRILVCSVCGLPNQAHAEDCCVGRALSLTPTAGEKT